MEKLVIIPTYNERENISKIIQAIFELNQNYNILVIDDNSPDGTADVVKSKISEYPDSLFILERKGKLGLGTAYIMGFEWGLKNGYQYIFEMDADFSHDPNDLERLYAVCYSGEADLSVGSRYVKGGSLENWPLSRKLISKAGAAYSQLITWMPVKDPTAGFVCYSSRVLSSINLSSISFVGYAFQIEMKFAAWRLGFKIKEVPITFRDRKFGTSKMTANIIKEGINGVLSMQIQYLLGRYIKKIRN